MLSGGARPDPPSRVPGRCRGSRWHSRPSSAKPSRRHTGPVDPLRTPLGEQVLAEVAARGDGDVLATVAALRRRYDAELVAAAVTQVRLRTRARAKFGADADRMFFTAEGLEQATRAAVAQR